MEGQVIASDTAPTPAVSAEARRLVDEVGRTWKRAGGGPSDYPPQRGWAGELIAKADAADQTLSAYIAGLEAERDRLAEAMGRIARWADAYPIDIWPEPDAAYLAKAHEVLTANGMTLDRTSAGAMRHVVQGVGEVARAALNVREGGDAR